MLISKIKILKVYIKSIVLQIIKGIDIMLYCFGLEETNSIGINLLSKGGTFLIAGLLGNMIKTSTISTVINEFKITGFLWGNYNELREVIELAKKE